MKKLLISATSFGLMWMILFCEEIIPLFCIGLMFYLIDRLFFSKQPRQDKCQLLDKKGKVIREIPYKTSR